jgi:hypothetical protein
VTLLRTLIIPLHRPVIAFLVRFPR